MVEGRLLEAALAAEESRGGLLAWLGGAALLAPGISLSSPAYTFGAGWAPTWMVFVPIAALVLVVGFGPYVPSLMLGYLLIDVAGAALVELALHREALRRLDDELLRPGHLPVGHDPLDLEPDLDAPVQARVGLGLLELAVRPELRIIACAERGWSLTLASPQERNRTYPSRTSTYPDAKI